MTNPEILDLAEKFPELNGVSFETIIGYTSAILQAASADQVCKHCSGIGSYVGSNDGCDDESCDHCDGTGKVRMNSNMNSNMNRSQAASTAPADRNAIQMTLVMRNGEPHAAYPRRKQAEVYASGFSGNEGLELIDGAFNSAAPVSSAQPAGVPEVTSDMMNAGADAMREGMVMMNSGRSYQAVCKKIFEAMTDAAPSLPAQPAGVPEWISVKDRMPKYGKSVIVANGGAVTFGWGRDPKYYGAKAARWENSMGVLRDVTHWMPLPAAPTSLDSVQSSGQFVDAGRYLKVRLMNPRLFTEVCRKSITEGIPLDKIIDALEPDLSNFDEVMAGSSSPNVSPVLNQGGEG